MLYHLKHPLLALETVCALTTEMAVVDSFVIDGEERDHISTPVPFMEFYETDELGGNIDNWFGPTVECLMALCRAAGFCRVDHVNTWHRHARVLCYRHWEPEPSGASDLAPVLKDALNTRDYGLNFRSRREEYLTLWFHLPKSEPQITRFDLRPEVGGFGVQAISLTADADHWVVNVQLPPGLTPGRHAIRLRTKYSRSSEPCHIYVDTPPVANGLEVRGLCDALAWRKDVCVSSTGRYATLYAGGTAENTDRVNLEIFIDDQRVQPTFIGEPDENLSRQVNFQCPADIPIGRHKVVICQAGVSSAGFAFDLVQ